MRRPVLALLVALIAASIPADGVQTIERLKPCANLTQPRDPSVTDLAVPVDAVAGALLSYTKRDLYVRRVERVAVRRLTWSDLTGSGFANGSLDPNEAIWVVAVRGTICPSWGLIDLPAVQCTISVYRVSDVMGVAFGGGAASLCDPYLKGSP